MLNLPSPLGAPSVWEAPPPPSLGVANSAWPLAWPGLQDGLGQGGPRLKWAKGRSGSKNGEKVKVLGMEFSIVENLSGLQESMFLSYLEAPKSI